MGALRRLYKELASSSDSFAGIYRHFIPLPGEGVPEAADRFKRALIGKPAQQWEMDRAKEYFGVLEGIGTCSREESLRRAVASSFVDEWAIGEAYRAVDAVGEQEVAQAVRKKLKSRGFVYVRLYSDRGKFSRHNARQLFEWFAEGRTPAVVFRDVVPIGGTPARNHFAGPLEFDDDAIPYRLSAHYLRLLAYSHISGMEEGDFHLRSVGRELADGIMASLGLGGVVYVLSGSELGALGAVLAFGAFVVRDALRYSRPLEKSEIPEEVRKLYA